MKKQIWEQINTINGGLIRLTMAAGVWWDNATTAMRQNPGAYYCGLQLRLNNYQVKLQQLWQQFEAACE